MRYIILSWVCTLAFVVNGQDKISSDLKRLQSLFEHIENSKDAHLSDSLADHAIEVAKRLDQDSLIGEAYHNKAGIFHQKRDFIKSIPLWHETLSAFLKGNNADRAIKTISYYGWSYLQFDNYTSADSIYQIGVKLNDQTSISKKSKYILNQGIATVHHVQRKFDQAIEYFLKASHFLDSTDDGLFAQFHGNLANTYTKIQRFDEAKEYHRISIRASKKTGTCSEMYSLISLGTIMYDFSEYDSAIHYFDEAIACAIKRGDKLQEGYINSYKVTTHTTMGNIDEAGKAALRASSLLSENTSPIQKAALNGSIGNYYNKKKDYKKAIKYCEEGLALLDLTKNPVNYQKLCRCLINANRSLGRYEKAMKYYDMRAVSVDSANFQHLERKIAQKESAFAIEKEKQEMAREVELKESEFELNLLKQKNTRNLLLAGLLALGLASVLLIRSNRKKRKFNNELDKKNKIIQEALEEKDLLLREIHHRVKNNLQIISSLLSLQSRQIEDQDIKQAINEGRNRVRSMALIHQNLYRQENLTGIRVPNYIQTLLQELFDTFKIDADRIQLDLDIQDIELDVDAMVPIGLIVNELVTNSLKYAFPNNRKGTLAIKLKEENNALRLHVWDDGIGMTNEDLQKKNSFGSRMIKAFLDKMSGTIAYSFSEGTKVDISITDYKTAA